MTIIITVKCTAVSVPTLHAPAATKATTDSAPRQARGITSFRGATVSAIRVVRARQRQRVAGQRVHRWVSVQARQLPSASFRCACMQICRRSIFSRAQKRLPFPFRGSVLERLCVCPSMGLCGHLFVAGGFSGPVLLSLLKRTRVAIEPRKAHTILHIIQRIINGRSSDVAAVSVRVICAHITAQSNGGSGRMGMLIRDIAKLTTHIFSVHARLSPVFIKGTLSVIKKYYWTVYFVPITNDYQGSASYSLLHLCIGTPIEI